MMDPCLTAHELAHSEVVHSCAAQTLRRDHAALLLDQEVSIPKILFALNLRKLEGLPAQTAIHPSAASKELEP
jgi:hypothetical protein